MITKESGQELKRSCCNVARVRDFGSLATERDQKLLDYYPELKALVDFKNQLCSIPAGKRGALVLRSLDVIEITLRRFRRLMEVEVYGN